MSMLDQIEAFAEAADAHEKAVEVLAEHLKAAGSENLALGETIIGLVSELSELADAVTDLATAMNSALAAVSQISDMQVHLAQVSESESDDVQRLLAVIDDAWAVVLTSIHRRQGQ